MELEAFTVSKINGDSVTIDVKASYTVWQAKNLLQPLLDIPASEMTLIEMERGAILEDDDVLLEAASARALQVVREISTWLERGEYRSVKRLGVKATCRSSGMFYQADLVIHQDSKFVVKSISCAKAATKQKRQAVRESQMFLKLRHPNLIRYYEVALKPSDHEDWIFLSMDYCPLTLSSKLLKARVEKKALATWQVMQWLTQGLLALEYLHESHIVHQHLKCSKLLLTQDGTLKVGGLLPDHRWATVGAGSYGDPDPFPWIISPELLASNQYTWHCDIWTMGCILYTMCALKPPFETMSIVNSHLKHAEAKVPSLPREYRDAFGSICSKMLSFDSGVRPRAQDVLEEIKYSNQTPRASKDANMRPQSSEATRSDKGAPVLRPRFSASSNSSKLGVVRHSRSSGQVAGPDCKKVTHLPSLLSVLSNPHHEKAMRTRSSSKRSSSEGSRSRASRWSPQEAKVLPAICPPRHVRPKEQTSSLQPL